MRSCTSALRPAMTSSVQSGTPHLQWRDQFVETQPKAAAQHQHHRSWRFLHEPDPRAGHRLRARVLEAGHQRHAGRDHAARRNARATANGPTRHHVLVRQAVEIDARLRPVIVRAEIGEHADERQPAPAPRRLLQRRDERGRHHLRRDHDVGREVLQALLHATLQPHESPLEQRLPQQRDAVAGALAASWSAARRRPSGRTAGRTDTGPSAQSSRLASECAPLPTFTANRSISSTTSAGGGMSFSITRRHERSSSRWRRE